MKITLRSLDSVNSVPALKEDRKLETLTKFDTIIYNELDLNFINLISYLKDVNEVLNEIKTKTDSKEQIKQIENLISKVSDIESNLSKIDLTKDADKPISNLTLERLSEKLDKTDFLIKTINNTSLIGTGNIEIKPTKNQVIESFVTGVAGDVGYYGIFDTDNSTNFNDILQGSRLKTLSGSTMTGTWRQCGNITPNKALFLRIL